MGKTSLALKDGSGYIGYLETFHMLHCVVSGLSFANGVHFSCPAVLPVEKGRVVLGLISNCPTASRVEIPVHGPLRQPPFSAAVAPG